MALILADFSFEYGCDSPEPGVANSRDYYAACQPGLENRFIDAVQAAIRRACDKPEQYRKFDGEIRRCLVHVVSA